MRAAYPLRQPPHPCLLRQLLILTVLCGFGLHIAIAQVNVLTYHEDQARTGQNTNETVLTPTNVNVNTFGQLFSYTVDGYLWAQPLYVSDLTIPGQGTHNVVFAATEHNSVYAFDADSNVAPNGGLLWQVNLGTSAATPNNDFGGRYGAYHDINPEVGITSTPVIDLAAGTIYVDAFIHDGPGAYHHSLHALALTNGAERLFSPATVSASVPGNTVDSVGGVVNFNPVSLQRPALGLDGGILYVCYAGFADTDPYHGWVIGFNAANLQQLAGYVFNTTPNATIPVFGQNAAEGGLWMSGNGPSFDSSGNLYFEVANGSFDANVPGGTEYADSFVKLSSSSGLAVADFFTPYNQATLATNDTDLGSGGPFLLPDSAGSPVHPHLIAGCGKEGTIYLVDRDNMGKFNTTDNSQIVQELTGAVGGTWSSGAYFNNRIYYQGVSDVLKCFSISNAVISTSPVSQSGTSFGFPGATPVISANGVNNAIVWVTQSDGYPSTPAILHAYNAYNVSQELYNSSQNATRDAMGNAVKFTLPIVANGKVYAGAQYSLSVFGLGNFLAVPTITPNGGVFTNSATVSLADSTSGTTIYYTLDNSAPSTNSILYSGPFVITNTAEVRVQAFKAGFVPSTAVATTFLNSASLILAPGFLEQQFYSGATRADLENPAFSSPPTFTNYVPALETPSGQGVNYAERVSGFFIAPQTTNYVFFVCSDDDSDLFLGTDSSPVSKQLIASETAWSNPLEWLSSGGGSVVASKRSDQFTGTTWPSGNTIMLTAGTTYYIEADHHQGGGGDNLAATFKFAGASDPTNGSPPQLTGPLIATYSFGNTYITLAASPQNTQALEGTSATFTMNATAGYYGASAGGTAPPLEYQWQSAPAGSGTFSNIPNATGSSYTTPPLMPGDNGSKFRALLATVGFSTNSGIATLTVIPDTNPPVVLGAGAFLGSAQVGLSFNKDLDGASAGNPVNYKINGVTVSSVIIRTNVANELTNEKNLVSVTAVSPIGGAFTVTVSGVKDLSGNAMSPTTIVGTLIHLGDTDIGSPSGAPGGPDPEVAGTLKQWGPGSFDVHCGGNDYWNNADGFNFLWEPKTNSFDVKVRVVSVQGINNWSAGAIEVREGPVTTNGGGWELARHYFCKVDYGGPTAALDGSGTGANTYEFNCRLAPGDPAIRETGNSGPGESYGWGGTGPGNPSPVPYPNAWIRIARVRSSDGSSDHLMGYSSGDGTNWSLREDVDLNDSAHASFVTSAGTAAGAWPSVCYVGLGSTSHTGIGNGNPTNSATGLPYEAWVVYRNWGDTVAVVVNPTLTFINNADGTVTLSYTGNLYSSDTVNGAYTLVLGALSPFVVNPKASGKSAIFYRAGP
jgi:hypothetical protein